MTEGYVLTLRARQDLADIAEAIAEESGSARALRVIETMRGTFRFLAENPRVGHPRADLSDDPGVRFWPVFSYLVAFVPGETRADLLGIVGILHGARDPEKIRHRLRRGLDR